MSQPLTADQFEKFENRFDAFVDLYTENHADHTKRLDKIDGRLDAIEKLLWQGERLTEIERRVIKLAELNGAADLATPFSHFLHLDRQ